MSDPYQIKYSEEALKSLKKIDKAMAKRIIAKIDWLAENIDDYSHDALTGNWSGYFRIRVGDYRIIYILLSDELLITIERIGHGRNVYD